MRRPLNSLLPFFGTIPHLHYGTLLEVEVGEGNQRDNGQQCDRIPIGTSTPHSPDPEQPVHEETSIRSQ